MTPRTLISASVSRLALSLLLLLASAGAGAQGFFKYQQDSIPLFRGFAVSFDLVGLAQLQLSDYGQYEAALRLNLHDQYFPTFELGYGRANHEDDEVTGISYKTHAPYFRIGADVNIMKKKHTGNRVFIGFRYAFTSYKVDVSRQPFPDPVWKWDTSFGVSGESCHQHWAELLFGIDAKVAGPLHLGWSARYRTRLAHDDGIIGKTWYVPGYGTQDSSALGATFNVTIDI
ncbi:MAG: hypothetical protein IJ841_06420 [Prevotella sp.]|nr:hypothetical protein [Prevotella sp.]